MAAISAWEGENQRRWMKLTKGQRMRSKRGQRAAPWRRRKTGDDEGRMGSVLSFAGGDGGKGVPFALSRELKAEGKVHKKDLKLLCA